MELPKALLALLLVLCVCYLPENSRARVKQETQGRTNICTASDSHRNKTVLATKAQESILNPSDWYLGVAGARSITDPWLRTQALRCSVHPACSVLKQKTWEKHHNFPLRGFTSR